MKDRFGNEIKFQHEIRNGYPVISKIIDSVQREVDLSYTDECVTLTIEDETDAQNAVTIKYNKSPITDQPGKYFLESVEYLMA